MYVDSLRLVVFAFRVLAEHSGVRREEVVFQKKRAQIRKQDVR